MSTTISRTGTTIAVNSNTIDLSTLLQIDFAYVGPDGFDYDFLIPASAFLTQTTTDITFTIPNICTFFDNSITTTLTGIQFSGSVALGTLAILLANSSGIYTLVASKTHDTLYIASDLEPTTQDVAIPTPMFKTGFIGV